MRKHNQNPQAFKNYLISKNLPTHDDYRATINNIIVALEEIKKLPNEYEKKTSSRFFSNSQRLSAIDLILNVADEFKIQKPSEKNNKPNNLFSLKALAKSSANQLDIVHGACLYVYFQIEKSYQDAWLSKDPHSSELYKTLNSLLSEQLDGLNEAKQTKALQAFKSFLEQSANQDKLFGGQKGKDILASLTLMPKLDANSSEETISLSQ